MNKPTFERDQFEKTLERRALARQTLRVLVVDDDPSILELLQTALSSFGNFEVTVANSAASALKLIDGSDAAFDCLLLDIQMPTTSGIELLRDIRARAHYEETPVIMLTAMSERQYVDEAFLEGATDYVAKPFDFFELRSRMNAAHKLMQERAKSKKSRESALSLKKELETTQQFNFEDPLSIDGVDRLLRYVEFDNYVEQLSRGRLFDSAVTAVKILDGESYFDLTNCSEFRNAVVNVATSISETTEGAKAIFSYRGSGVFLIVTHGRRSTATLPSQEKLNQTYGSYLANRAPGWVQILSGQPIPMRTIARSGATATLRKAVEDVNELEVISRTDTTPEAKPVQKVANAPSKERMPKRIPKGLYEKVLWELFGKESYLAQK